MVAWQSKARKWVQYILLALILLICSTKHLALAKKKKRGCGLESASCEEHEDCCYPMMCVSPGQTEDGKELPTSCIIEYTIEEKYAMALVYMQKHKPWMEPHEMRGFVDSNEHSWYKIGLMLEKKAGEFIWDLWDDLEYEEQELYMDDARLAYPLPEEPVEDELETLRGELNEDVEVSEDGDVEL